MPHLKTNAFNYSALESNRFGLRVFRDDIVETIAFDRLRDRLIENAVDIYIFRTPAENGSELYRLNEVGCPFIVADTIVYYACPIRDGTVNPLIFPDVQFEVCLPDDVDILEPMIDVMFRDYQNHYRANPVLDRVDIIECYKEWVRSYVQPEESGRCTFLIRRDDAPVGFATFRLDQDASDSEVVFGGLVPSAAGGGLYGELMRFGQNYALAHGYETMRISTQVQNYAVQKVWGREGPHMTAAYVTVHINSMFGENQQSQKPAKQRIGF